jgi:hypothetical protein
MPYVSSAEQIELEQFQDLGEAVTQFCPEFVVGKQKERDDRDPDLSHNRVPAGAQEGLDLEVLLDPFEEELNLPPLTVDIGNGPRRKVKDIGDKHVVLSGLCVPVADSSERHRAVFSLGAGQLDDLIRGEPLCEEDGIAFDDPGLNPSFHPGDEEDVFLRKLVEPSKIQVRSVYNHDRESRQIQELGDGEIGHLGGGDPDECRNVAVVIDKGMEFDPTFSGAELGPREKR